MGDPTTAALVVLLVLLAAAYLLQRAGRNRYDARVDVRGGDVRAVGRLSPAALNSLRAFFRNDFTHRDPLTVFIRRRPADRTFQIRFVPDVSPGERQQVRNFLAAHLSR
jgi:hypothetical protein